MEILNTLKTETIAALEQKPLFKDGAINLAHFSAGAGGFYYFRHVVSTDVLSFLIEYTPALGKFIFKIGAEDFEFTKIYDADLINEKSLIEYIDAFFSEAPDLN